MHQIPKAELLTIRYSKKRLQPEPQALGLTITSEGYNYASDT